MGLKMRCATDYPLYAVRALGNYHIMVAGGGGSSRTGVPNAMEVYRLSRVNGNAIQATSIYRYDSGEEAIMNVGSHPKEHVIACGMSEKCQLLSLQDEFYEVESDETLSKEGSRNDNDVSQDCNRKISVQVGRTIQTDFHKVFPRQKVVVFTHYGLKMITGGADGHIRIWKYPELQLQLEITAHADDIDELDVNETGTRIVSVSHDGQLCIWNTTNGEKEKDLAITFSKVNEKYIARGCKFSATTGSSECLYTVHNPMSTRSKGHCYLVKWNADDHEPLKYRAVGKERATKMIISDDGNFLGLGTTEGSILICTTFNLKMFIRVPNAHTSVVTDLAFSRCTPEARELIDSDVALISTSIDRKFCVTTLPKRREVSAVVLILVFIVAIYIIFTYMDQLGI